MSQNPVLHCYGLSCSEDVPYGVATINRAGTVKEQRKVLWLEQLLIGCLLSNDFGFWKQLLIALIKQLSIRSNK